MIRNKLRVLPLVLTSGFSFVIAGTAWSDVELVAPQTLQVNIGRLVDGNVASLGMVDLNDLVLRRGFIPNVLSDSVRFTVMGRTHNMSPIAFSFTVMSQALDPGTYQQTIDLFNFSTGAWSPAATGPMTLVYTPLEALGTGALSRFVNQADGMVGARIHVRQVGLAAVALPGFAWDSAGWQIVDL